MLLGLLGGVLWAESVLQECLACFALPPFPLRSCCREAESAFGPAISCRKMLLPFKREMVLLPCRTRHLEMGDSLSA